MPMLNFEEPKGNKTIICLYPYSTFKDQPRTRSLKVKL